MTTGGAAQPVVVSTAAPSAGPAQPIVVVSDGRATLAGPCQAVVAVSDGRPVLAGPALPVVVATGQRAGNVLAGPPLPVYVVSGSLGGSALLNDLMVYYKANEGAGAAMLDSGPNALHLTDVNGVGTAAGKIGSARSFAAAYRQYKIKVNAAALQTGNIDFTFWCWLNGTTLANDAALASKGQQTGSTREWLIRNDGAGKPSFQIYADGSNIAAKATWGSVLSSAAWHFIVVWHDSVGDTINIQIDNGTPVTTATAGAAPVARAGQFRLGSENGAGFFDGLIDEAGFSKRVLTTGERTALWNGGAGLTYPF